MKEKIKTVLVGRNGQIAVCDEQGVQIPQLQGNLILEWAERARDLGYEVVGVKVEVIGQTPITATLEIVEDGDGQLRVR